MPPSPSHHFPAAAAFENGPLLAFLCFLFPLLSARSVVSQQFTGLNAATSLDASSNNGLSKSTKVMHCVAVKRQRANKVALLSDPNKSSSSRTINAVWRHMRHTSNYCCSANIKQVKTCSQLRQLQCGRDNQTFFSLLAFFLLTIGGKKFCNSFSQDEPSAGQQLQRNEALVLIWFSLKSGACARSDLLSSLGSSRCGKDKKKKTGTVIFDPTRRTEKLAQAQRSTATCSVVLLCSDPSICNLMRLSAVGQRHGQHETLRSGIIMGAAGFFFSLRTKVSCLEIKALTAVRPANIKPCMEWKLTQGAWHSKCKMFITNFAFQISCRALCSKTVCWPHWPLPHSPVCAISNQICHVGRHTHIHNAHTQVHSIDGWDTLLCLVLNCPQAQVFLLAAQFKLNTEWWREGKKLCFLASSKGIRHGKSMKYSTQTINIASKYCIHGQKCLRFCLVPKIKAYKSLMDQLGEHCNTVSQESWLKPWKAIWFRHARIV